MKPPTTNPRRRIPPVDRFWPKVHKLGPVPGHNTGLGKCWVWTSALDFGGYPILWIGDGRSVRAHRFSYQLLVGPIPEGLTLDHLCRNKRCVNPAHLDPCTAGENARRSPLAPYNVRATQTHCKRGHEFSEQNTMIHHGRRECRECHRARQRERNREQNTA
jgi:hypothetical protein